MGTTKKTTVAGQPPKNKRPTSVKKLLAQAQSHYGGMRVAESLGNRTIYEWHQTEVTKLREEIRIARSRADKLDPGVVRARDTRWRHYGARGQVSNALIAVRGMKRLPTVTSEARTLMDAAEVALDKLYDALLTRVDPK